MYIYHRWTRSKIPEGEWFPFIQIEAWFNRTFYRRSHSKGLKQRALHVHKTKTKHFIAKLFAQPIDSNVMFSICMFPFLRGRDVNFCCQGGFTTFPQTKKNSPASHDCHVFYYMPFEKANYEPAAAEILYKWCS